jgi:hypothetical protein
MRVRHLQSHLADSSLVHQNKLDRLKNTRVGVDAVFWLRSIQALKDPFADALGGIPPGIFGFVDKELELFKRFNITPLFVFQGVAPGPQHSMFVSRMDTQMEMAWTFLAKGSKSEAQKCFAVSTSRINGDFVYFIFHHLKNKGYECLQAPYFAGAQLAHFAEQGVVQAVFGPPGLLLYGVQSAVIHMDFIKNTFDWVDLSSVLEKWGISRDQFVDACMLAGTEYCLTYPYLNLGHFQQAQGGRFNFDAAVFIIKQAPLINWMQTFPTEEMKNDHVDGYCTCKVLVQSSPVLHLSDHAIRPLGARTSVPFDFSQIMGEKLPSVLYYLMLNGIISHKLPQALAKGEWTDKSQPLVDTANFRELLQDLSDYRQTALGLIARHLHSSFHHKKILFKAYWDPHQVRQGSPANQEKLPPDARIVQPVMKGGLKWNLVADQVAAETKRQGCDRIDFKFCLQWHAHEFETDGALIPTREETTPNIWCSNDLNALTALVHMMVLENLELIADDGGMTFLGNVLKETPRHLQESTLVALELMKTGMLSSEPFEPAQQDRPFPAPVQYPSSQGCPPRTKAIMLLSRVMSLVPMKLKNDMWNADVDFDLAAFHSLVRILKRTLRQLVEASLTSMLIKDLSLVKLLPPGFMCATPNKEDHLRSPGVLPAFPLPRACMGIVARHFLEYTGPPENLKADTQSKFPCCLQPLADLKVAFEFWDDLRRCVDAIADPLECTDLRDEMAMATEQILRPQQKRLQAVL